MMFHSSAFISLLLICGLPTASRSLIFCKLSNIPGVSDTATSSATVNVLNSPRCALTTAEDRRPLFLLFSIALRSFTCDRTKDIVAILTSGFWPAG